MTQIRYSDIDGALAVIADAAATHGTQPFGRPVIERLMGLIPADHLGYFEFSGGGLRSGGNTFYVEAPEGAPGIFSDPGRTDAVEATIASWPLLEEYVAGSPLPLKLSDFLTHKQRTRNPFYAEVLRPLGYEDQLKVWLPAKGATVRGFFFVRGHRSGDFDERDRTLLTLLRPHLTAIRERWERRRRPELLTAREIEVLELVAQGLTNTEIATRLVITRTTVRTHLENIFAKIGVHTRTAAATWLQGDPAASGPGDTPQTE
jgi:DNA-binding CsgD family transcriptional regulator